MKARMGKEGYEKTDTRDATALLDVVRTLALELHPRRKGSLEVTLDSSLERDLGFDSWHSTTRTVKSKRASRIQAALACIPLANEVAIFARP